MFNKKKYEDQYDKILNAEDIQQKIIFLRKQIDFFKSQKPFFDYNYKEFLIKIEEFQISKNYEYNLIWLQTINEIIRLNQNLKKKYFKPAMKIVFSNRDEENKNNLYSKDEENNIKINSIAVFTNNCEEIFECDNYFQNCNRLKNLLELFIFDLFPYHYKKENNKLLLLLSNIFFNINKNKESKNYLKNNYFSVMFNLLIEILCFLCLYNSFKIIDTKIKSSFALVEAGNNNLEIGSEHHINLSSIEEVKNKYKDLINKSNKLFDLYLGLSGAKNNRDSIINYQMLIKIFIVHCLESQYNESYCIEWFLNIYNKFSINKILKIITESFDDEIFDLFHINENSSNKKKIIINEKLKNVNHFFYLSDNRTKEIECKNNYYNFIHKFNKLRKKLIESKEYVYNGLFMFINILFNEILTKQNLKMNFKEEFIIITLIKCVMKYMIKTSVTEMIEDNKNNIDILINLIIDSFGNSLSEKIWKELMVLIKYFYSELSKKEEEYAIKQLSVILKKMIRLNINGIHQFDEKMFYDLLNKVCESKNNIYIIEDHCLFAVYFKNKFKSLKSLDKSISSFTKLFITLIKEKYHMSERNNSQNGDIFEVKKTKEIDLNSEKVLEIFANYILIYFSVYSQMGNKNIELFLYKNLNYLNFYFCNKKIFHTQYINLVINILNNTSDLNYFQCLISYLISLHSSEINVLEEELIEKSLNLYKKIIIKLINKLSSTYQIKKLDYLFESIYNRLNANVNDDIDYNFLKNILEIFSYMNVTKYNEILINDKIISKMKTLDIIRKIYFSIGKNIYTSIVTNNFRWLSKNDNKEWCIIDIKEIFAILINLLKKKNINIECKEEIINFIKNKINDIFFFNKIDINMFLDYVIELDNDNLNEFLLYTYKRDTILTINDILKNIAYFIIYNKTLFEIENYYETYEKLINYVFDKINYFKQIIRLIIKKYYIKIIKNKNSKHFIFMKNLLGSDEEGMPNILNLRLDINDFKFSGKEKEKDINYQIFINENIDIDKFVYPKKNLEELLNYLKSYFDILEICLNSLIYTHIKNINLNNIPFIKQLKKDLKISFDKDENQKDSEDVELFKKNSESISSDLKNKYDNICEKLFKIFDKFPDVIKYQNSFLYDLYKLFLYCKDFIVFCGEKYIIQTILLLLSISFPNFYQKFYDNLNIEFKFKYNSGKDFPFQKIESIQIQNIDDISSIKSKEKNSSKQLYSNSKQVGYSSSFLSEINKKSEKSCNEVAPSNWNKNIEDNFVSRSVVNLQKEVEQAKEEDLERLKSSDEFFDAGLNTPTINDAKKDKRDKIENKIFLIRKLIIEFIIKSKDSLKIYHIINNIIKENENNDEEEIILFLLLCKWRIINDQNWNRYEDINIFKNRRKIKNYFNNDIYNISSEDLYQKKTVAIKSPISSFNYIIYNNYKTLPNKDTLKTLTQSLVDEKHRKSVEDALNQKKSQENINLSNQTNKRFSRNDSNSFCYRSSSKILNEIKELEEEDNNLSNSDEKKSKSEQDDENNFLDDDFNNQNIEELISIMHEKTKNNLFKIYESELNKIFYKFNLIDKGMLYNEMNIYASCIINRPKNGSLFNLYNSTFMKFLKKLTTSEDGHNSPYNQMKLNDQKEFIYSDNYNIIKYILKDIESSSYLINSNIYLIFNDTLTNKSNKTELIIKNNIDKNNEFVYLYICIIPVSDEFWKVELRCNEKKNDEFSKKLKNMVEMNFLNCYFFSIKNNFAHLIYQLKILLSILQNLICNIKDEINDKKLRNKLTGIKHEEMIERFHAFKSIDAF